MKINNKNLIVNGKVNPSLSKSEFLEFCIDRSCLLGGCWNLIVSMTNSYNQCTDLNWIDAPSHTELEKTILSGSQSEALKLAGSIFDRFLLFKDQHRVKTFDADIIKGEKLGEVMNNVLRPEAGAIYLNTAQFLGLSKTLMRDFNNFEVQRLQRNVLKVYELNIFNDYGINNPNTGQDCLFWCLDLRNLDYVDCVFTTSCGITQLTEEKITSAEGQIKCFLQDTKPDSVKRINDYWPNVNAPGNSNKIYSVKYRMFWD